MSQAYAQDDVGLIRRLLQQNQWVSLSILVLLGSFSRALPTAPSTCGSAPIISSASVLYGFCW